MINCYTVLVKKIDFLSLFLYNTFVVMFMTKLMLIPSDKNFDYDVSAYLIGIKELSVNMPIYFDISELDNINTDKEIFVCLNKNMHKTDLDNLENTLKQLKNIKGIFFYDIGVLNMVKKMNLDIDLVIAQEHLNTNYQTINFWHDLGIKYTLISTDNSVNEIKSIIENTKSKLIMPIFGYQPMFVSRRHLVNNYLEYFKLKDDSSVNYIYKEGKEYPIVDSGVTTVYTNDYLNGLEEYLQLNLDYALLNSFLIDSSDMKKIINIFNTVNDSNIVDYNWQDDKRLKLLLAHEPEYHELYKSTGADIVFTGHIHGGQIIIPGRGGLLSPDIEFFPKLYEGEHSFGDMTMYISRGMGNSLFPVRINDYPEIVLLKIH